MSERVGPEVIASLREQITSAWANAPDMTREDDIRHTQEDAGTRATLPDDDVMTNILIPEPYEVYTTDPALYRHLLIESSRLTPSGDFDERPLPEKDLDYIQGAYNHELAHHNEAQRWGCADTWGYFGVKFTVEKGNGLFLPIHVTEGPLRKIHRAAAAAAPYDRSDKDVAIVEVLGYDPDDLEGLRAKAEATPPVNDEWAREVERGLVNRALLTLSRNQPDVFKYLSNLSARNTVDTQSGQH